MQRATRLARYMVCVYGMSETLGPQAFSDPGGNAYLKGTIASLGQRPEHSERTAQIIDDEVTDILKTIHHRVTEMLTAHREILNRMAQTLKERETLEGAELKRILQDKAEPTLKRV